MPYLRAYITRSCTHITRPIAFEIFQKPARFPAYACQNAHIARVERLARPMGERPMGERARNRARQKRLIRRLWASRQGSAVASVSALPGLCRARMYQGSYLLTRYLLRVPGTAPYPASFRSLLISWPMQLPARQAFSSYEYREPRARLFVGNRS